MEIVIDTGEQQIVVFLGAGGILLLIAALVVGVIVLARLLARERGRRTTRVFERLVEESIRATTAAERQANTVSQQFLGDVRATIEQHRPPR
jgi:hypothetical protein